jgi:hypothetical protein
MRHKVIWGRDFSSHDFLRVVRVLFSAGITANLKLLYQHGEWRKAIRLSQDDAMFKRGIVFVVESAILADDNPAVVS